MAQYTGSVSGTLGSGSREDDHSEAGNSLWLYDNWLDARTATLSLSKSYHDAGVIGVGEAALDALLEFVAIEVVARPVLGAVIMLGEELTTVTGIEVLAPEGCPASSPPLARPAARPRHGFVSTRGRSGGGSGHRRTGHVQADG